MSEEKQCYYCSSLCSLKPWKSVPHSAWRKWACPRCWNKWLINTHGRWEIAANYLRNKINSPTNPNMSKTKVSKKPNKKN